HISTISIAELYTGIRDGVERDSLDAAIEACHVVDVTGVIARKAGLWQRTYGKSHGVHLPDALIAATVQEWSLTLATLNRRHFPMLADIVTPYGKSR
ncbi:MAG TPA: type II toxin-antitoxin system VapC family toxin, partial [Candidatus Ozemobacteraceae bacterium]|nr:type II toxin-antitoxin system VapC family toxin [Candidatus Ozemobacteraceae bacterium]